MGLGLCLLVSWVVYNNLPLLSQNTPETISSDTELILEGDLPIVGNYLLPYSYLPRFAGEVRGTIIMTGYCDVGYLEQFWGSEAENASRICKCEAQGEWWRVNKNGEYSIGIFQINLETHKSYDEEWLKDPINNINTAVKIFNDPNTGGWKNWWNCARWTGVIN